MIFAKERTPILFQTVFAVCVIFVDLIFMII